MKTPAVKKKKEKQTTPSGHHVLLTESETAKYLSLSPRALQSWRYLGKGPRFVKISGRCVRYRLADLEQWIRERLRRSTSDPGPQEAASDG